jgi:16S rRNA (guanine(966)-N(2))-methyltransferase RsmD
MRVIAGRAGGRRLAAPPGTATRPTSDRVREALFSILGPPPDGAAVLDLFAGAGALGIEALSRGAARAVFVDTSRAALRCVRRNLDDLDLAGAAEVHQDHAPRFAARLADAGRPAFTWIFLDPPYQTDLGTRCLTELGRSPDLLLADGAAVLEHDRRRAPDDRYGVLVKADCRRYGDTELSFYRTDHHGA